MELFIKVIPEGLGEKLLYPLSLKLSKTSRKVSRPNERIEQARSTFREYARELQKAHKANLVILGHSHISDNFQLSPVATYLNLGSWFESPQVGLLELKHKEITVKVSPLSAWLPTASKQ
jgi:UDP-2,3-diacylglucosamine pyrophosphatase LpxH